MIGTRLESTDLIIGRTELCKAWQRAELTVDVMKIAPCKHLHTMLIMNITTAMMERYLKTLKEVTHHTYADESDELETAKLIEVKDRIAVDTKPFTKWR